MAPDGCGAAFVAAPGLAFLSPLCVSGFAASPDADVPVGDTAAPDGAAAAPDGAAAAPDGAALAPLAVGDIVVVGVGDGATTAASFLSSHAASDVATASAISIRIIVREYCIPPRPSTARK
jgi:hypothetical protein